MSEASSSKRFLTYLQSSEAGRWTTKRVENTVEPGTPDVHFLAPARHEYTSGWIEFKWIAKLPHEPTARVRIMFRPAQPPWIRDYWGAGGLVWVVVAVGEGSALRWMLFGGDAVDEIATVKGERRTGPTLEQVELLDLNAHNPRRIGPFLPALLTYRHRRV